jgi:hypothetical protein
LTDGLTETVALPGAAEVGGPEAKRTVVIGVTAGAIALVGIAVVVAVALLRRKKKSPHTRAMEEELTAPEGLVTDFRTDLAQLTQVNPLDDEMPRFNLFDDEVEE